eukprot:9112829-Alexandrium_andersonii.AAC.1
MGDPGAAAATQGRQPSKLRPRGEGNRPTAAKSSNALPTGRGSGCQCASSGQQVQPQGQQHAATGAAARAAAAEGS